MTGTHALELEVVVRAPAGVVWSAIADADHRRTWWPYLELETRPGGRLLERCRDGDGREQTTRGEVLAAEPPHRLHCSWRDDGWPASTEVELAMRGDQETTRLRLRHSGWDRLPDGADLRAAHDHGWHMDLAHLTECAERIAPVIDSGTEGR